MTTREDNTQRLQAAAGGGTDALEGLFPLVYDELRRIAHRHLARRGRDGQTLTTTALVHETYLKLVDATRASWSDRAHFFALASRAMRFILVDHARSRVSAKRGGEAQVDLSLNETHVAAADRPEHLLAIDEALTALGQQSERLSQLVHYRFFGGMEYEEIAAVTGLSVPTVKRDWARARAWLYDFMREAPP